MLRMAEDAITIGAMAVESAGRCMRILHGGERADKGLVRSAQLLYSIASGIREFEGKMEGWKYGRKRL